MLGNESSITELKYDAVKSVALYAASDPGDVTVWPEIIETRPASSGNPAKPCTDELVYAIAEESASPVERAIPAEVSR